MNKEERLEFIKEFCRRNHCICIRQNTLDVIQEVRPSDLGMSPNALTKNKIATLLARSEYE